MEEFCFDSASPWTYIADCRIEEALAGFQVVFVKCPQEDIQTHTDTNGRKLQIPDPADKVKELDSFQEV